ncbi:hypothetical protein PG999_002970 [Apiospora kogelbergensis]|uniref:Deuterolysin n=1 Tax=Apiospora kogelbergensis TaxID=1337665 RepID=A0AAW0R9V5_9PEZI
MYFTQRTLLLVAGATATLALPLEESGSTLHKLVARTARYDPSCSRNIPGSDKTYETKARQAFTDASQLALTTQEGKDSNGNAFTESSAFSHYFGPGDKDQVRNVMQIIYNSRLPVDDNDGGAGYFIEIKCGSDQGPGDCSTGVIAATSPKPGETIVILCDDFFKASTKPTKQDLSSKKLGTRRGQWCQPGEDYPFFEVAGVTMLHELTHLHTVGNRAGLSSRPDPLGFDSSGTVDVYVKGGEDDWAKYRGMEPWQAARALHRMWDEHNGDESKYKPTTLSVHNAESYSAAALEFYFLVHCGWDVILPN